MDYSQQNPPKTFATTNKQTGKSMLFPTYTYAVFLILVFGLYFFLTLPGRRVILLIASYVFYCWVHPFWGVLLAISTVMDYFLAIIICRTENITQRRLLITISIVANIGLLFYFKYFNFAAENIVGLLQWLGRADSDWQPWQILLPAGISFYTFQTLSYTISVYRRQMPATKNFITFALYVSFFPQLVAGPIERATHLIPQLQVYQRVCWLDISEGLKRIVIGLFQKLVIADRLAIPVDYVFSDINSYSTLTIWLILPIFATQVYFDFNGYCSIAIGSARLLGINLTENFRHPMLATSISDFWNRWHITLSSWLRDYLFFPLGGFRHGPARTVLNLWILYIACGIWHGAAWNFVIWGVYHAVLNSLYYFWKLWRKSQGIRRTKTNGLTAKTLASIGFTFFFTFVLNAIFFRSPSLAVMKQVFLALVGQHPGAALHTEWYMLIYISIVAAIFLYELNREYELLKLPSWQEHWVIQTAASFALAVVVTFCAVNYSAPYVYFQF